MSKRKGPVLIDLEASGPAPTPAEAPPVPEPDLPAPPEGRAMQTAASLAARRPRVWRGSSGVWRWPF